MPSRILAAQCVCVSESVRVHGNASLGPGACLPGGCLCLLREDTMVSRRRPTCSPDVFALPQSHLAGLCLVTCDACAASVPTGSSLRPSLVPWMWLRPALDKCLKKSLMGVSAGLRAPAALAYPASLPALLARVWYREEKRNKVAESPMWPWSGSTHWAQAVAPGSRVGARAVVAPAQSGQLSPTLLHLLGRGLGGGGAKTGGDKMQQACLLPGVLPSRALPGPEQLHADRELSQSLKEPPETCTAEA